MSKAVNGKVFFPMNLKGFTSRSLSRWKSCKKVSQTADLGLTVFQVKFPPTHCTVSKEIFGAFLDR